MTAYPWDSTNPNVRRYYDGSSENIILDQIIGKEVETIEKIFEERLSEGTKRGRKAPDSEFSNYYNFMSELQKKLKQRIKQ